MFNKKILLTFVAVALSFLTIACKEEKKDVYEDQKTEDTLERTEDGNMNTTGEDVTTSTTTTTTEDAVAPANTDAVTTTGTPAAPVDANKTAQPAAQ